MKRIAYFIPFFGCTRRCVYCDQRAITADAAVYDCRDAVPPEMIEDNISKFEEPIELCFFGGSFARLDMPIFTRYIDCVSKAPPGSRVTFSSYPGDFEGGRGDEKIKLLGDRPVGTIELGVPSLDPGVLEICGREDDPARICGVISRLKRSGFHLGMQIMTGLPGQSAKSSLSDMETLASLKGADRWDMRIYPCLVLGGTELEKMYLAGEYSPQTLEEAVRAVGRLLLLADAMGFDVIRIGLLESKSLRNAVVAGPYHPAFGEMALSEKTVLELLQKKPNGPWEIEKKKLSRLTGHGRRGMKRLADLAGLRESEIESMLSLYADTNL